MKYTSGGSITLIVNAIQYRNSWILVINKGNMPSCHKHEAVRNWTSVNMYNSNSSSIGNSITISRGFHYQHLCTSNGNDNNHDNNKGNNNDDSNTVMIMIALAVLVTITIQ